MANILYLVHRLPYPPNKGDKVRSWHLLKHLAQRHRVFLGTFVDDPDDWQYLDKLRGVCAEVCALPLNPRLGKLRSLKGLVSGEPLGLPYYRDAAMSAWVQRCLKEQDLSASIVFSSTMAQYALGLPLPMLVDLIDVDSQKWAGYAKAHRWPMSWVYGREGRRLLDYERRIVAAARMSYLVTEPERQLFLGLAPGLDDKIQALCNGVDSDFFQPQQGSASPFTGPGPHLVFTGAMDYWPNVDAVAWFAEAVLPAVLQRHPQAQFHIVGRSPTAAVQALAGPQVRVTGTVPDVRPYLQHADAVVAPLRLARGVQNKVLEAMSMCKAVVSARGCAQVIGALHGDALYEAETAEEYLSALESVLADREQARRVGLAARRYVLDHYSWDAHLSAIDGALSRATGGAC